MVRLLRGCRERSSSSGVLRRALKPGGLEGPGRTLVLVQSYWGQVVWHSAIMSSRVGGLGKVQGSEKRSGVKLMVILKEGVSPLAAVDEDACSGSMSGVESILRFVFPGLLRGEGCVCGVQLL